IANISLESKLIAEPSDRYVLRTSDDSIYGGEILMKNRLRWMTRSISVPFAELALEHKSGDQVQFYLQACPTHIATDDQLLLFTDPEVLKRLKMSATKCGAFWCDAAYSAQLESK